MNKYHKIKLILLITTLVLSGCNGSTAATEDSEIDPEAIFTSVAQTMIAQVTQTAAALPPTLTPIPPTETPIPSPTVPMPILPPFDQPASPTVESAESEIQDSFLFLGQTPMDGQQFNKSSKFDAKFTFQNIGTNTWTPAYSIRYLGYGEKFNATESIYLFEKYADNTTVEPQGIVTITLPGLQAPAGSGSYIGYWCLFNNRDAEGLPPQCIQPLTIDIYIAP